MKTLVIQLPFLASFQLILITVALKFFANEHRNYNTGSQMQLYMQVAITGFLYFDHSAGPCNSHSTRFHCRAGLIVLRFSCILAPPHISDDNFRVLKYFQCQSNIYLLIFWISYYVKQLSVILYHISDPLCPFLYQVFFWYQLQPCQQRNNKTHFQDVTLVSARFIQLKITQIENYIEAIMCFWYQYAV